MHLQTARLWALQRSFRKKKLQNNQTFISMSKNTLWQGKIFLSFYLPWRTFCQPANPRLSRVPRRCTYSWSCTPGRPALSDRGNIWLPPHQVCRWLWRSRGRHSGRRGCRLPRPPCWYSRCRGNFRHILCLHSPGLSKCLQLFVKRK